jgi:glyceraldehyde 3-phosphate dehydrogenase
MKKRVAINGFGRIGREMFRIAMKSEKIEIVAINNLSDNGTLAHLLKYDSNYGTLDAEVKTEGADYIVVNGKKIRYFQEKDPAKIPWESENVDIVLESTGVFNDKESAGKHLHGTVKKVIVTAVAKGADAIICLGVNENSYDPKNHHVISNASCTTNCMAPIIKILHNNLKVKRGLMTTVHSYTNDQNILDLPHKDPRRARAAALSMIPTTTGAATAVAMVIPELKGKLNGLSVRVPTPTVSLLDVTCEVEKATDVEAVNNLFKQASQNELKGILDYNELPLVSIDYKGNTHSAIIDGLSTMVMEGNMVKVVAWYDNEWGYSCRVIELTEMVAERM